VVVVNTQMLEVLDPEQQHISATLRLRICPLAFLASCISAFAWQQRDGVARRYGRTGVTVW